MAVIQSVNAGNGEVVTTMNDKLSTLLDRIQQLEQELLAEIQKKEAEFSYEVRDRKAHFTKSIITQHRKLAKTVASYVRESKLFNVLTSPVIWVVLVPVVLLHAMATVFQWVCFPVYGIPKVLRRDYIVMDRRVLSYLNPLERLNCGYCEYTNGVLAYVQEIAGRTEQYRCPIKHAIGLKTRHSRYSYFLDFGDAEQYRARIEQVRRDFQDLQKKTENL
jgi:ElaB/YqjD/DUF883 family membrane-anchored ribosome-binding protein